MMTPAQDSRNGLNNFHKLVSVKGVAVPDGIIGSAAPTAKDKSVAMGRMPISGCLTVGTTLAATVSIRLWNDADRDWWIPGSGSPDSSKVFAAGKTFDYFYAQPGTPYFLYSTVVTSNPIYDNGDEFVFRV